MSDHVNPLKKDMTKHESPDYGALLSPTEIFRMDPFDFVRLIESELVPFMRPLEPNTYLKGQMLPVFQKGRLYFTKKGLATNTPITSLDGLTETIYDYAGNVVIPPNVMRNKDRYLSGTPTMPLQTAMVLEAYIKYYLEQMCPYRQMGGSAKALCSLFNEQGQEMFEEGTIERILEPVGKVVRDFVGRDTWHIYFVKLEADSVFIEKTIDYRIYQYYEMLDELNIVRED